MGSPHVDDVNVTAVEPLGQWWSPRGPAPVPRYTEGDRDDDEGPYYVGQTVMFAGNFTLPGSRRADGTSSDTA
jgi:hypothetical protein